MRSDCVGEARTNILRLKYTVGPVGKSRNDSNKNIITQL